MKHLRVKMEFIPIEEKPMPHGYEFLVLFRVDDPPGVEFDRAFIEKEPDAGPEGMVWDPSMIWNYDECEDVTITHWAKLPVILITKEG